MGEHNIEPYRGRYQAVLFFGPPGSGKGTQAQFLKALTHHVHLSSGDVFRGLSPESPTGKVFYEYASSGHLVPDQVTIDIFTLYVQGLVATNRLFPASQLLLLDGLPRTVPQVKLIESFIDVRRVIVFDGAEEVFIQRLKSRAEKEKRFDDADPKVLAKRMEVYHNETAPVLKAYPESLISRFDATGTPLEVFREVLNTHAELFS